MGGESYGSDITRIRQLNEIGIALSSERNHDALLENLLTSARELTQADAGTLYTFDASKQQLSLQSYKTIHWTYALGT